MNKWILGGAVVSVCAVCATVGVVTATVLLRGQNADTDEDTRNVVAAPTLGYATEGITATDENTLNRDLERALAESDQMHMGLSFRETAYSTDGINFTCYLGNSAGNTQDMYIQIFADADLQDELYLSQLLRPGSAFQSLTLNHALPTGDNEVFAAFTQVEAQEDGSFAIVNQNVITLTFHVEAS